jgi:hypothetical protein
LLEQFFGIFQQRWEGAAENGTNKLNYSVKDIIFKLNQSDFEKREHN